MAEENCPNEELSANGGDESNKEVEQETNKNGKVISDEKVSLIIEESNMNGESENNISKESQNNARKEAEINTNSDLDLNLNGDDSFGDLQIVEFDEDVKPETIDEGITEAANASQETANQIEATNEN